MWALAYFPRDSDIATPQPAHIVDGEQSPAELSESQRAAHYSKRVIWVGRTRYRTHCETAGVGLAWRRRYSVFPSAGSGRFNARHYLQSGGRSGRESERYAQLCATPYGPTGERCLTCPVALSIMVFFALCAQCAATTSDDQKGNAFLALGAFSFFYMTGLYVGAFCTYR